MSGLDRVRLLHLRSLRSRPARTALVLLSVAVSAAVLVGVLSVPGSLEAAADRAGSLLPSNSLVVLAPSDAGMPAGITDEIRAVRGVRVAAPVVRRKVLSPGGELVVLGVDAESLRTGGPLTPQACGFVLADVVGAAVVGPGVTIPPGGEVAVRSGDGHRGRIEVSARSSCPELADFNAGRVLVTDLATAQRLTGRPDRVDLVSVATAANRDRVTERLRFLTRGRAAVQASDTSAVQATDAMAPLTQGVGVVAGIAGVVAGFVVYSAMSIAATERRRQFALLRAVGMRRKATRNGILAEAAVVGALGAILGSVAGLPLGRYLVDTAPRLVVDAVGYEPLFRPPAFLVPAVVVGLTLLAVIAAVAPALQVTEVTPIEAMRAPEDADAEPDAAHAVRLVIGGVALLAATAVGLVFVTGPASVATFGLALGAALLFVLAAADVIIGFAAAIVDDHGTSGRLAAIDLRRSRRRTTSVLLAVVVAVSTLVGFRGLIDNIQSTYTSRLASIGEGDLVVQAGRADQIAIDHRLTDDTVAAIRELPEVDRTTEISLFLVNIDEEVVQFDAVGPGARDPALAGVAPGAVRAMHRGEGVIVNSTFATRQGLEVGDVVEVPTLRGMRRLPLLAIGGYYTLTPGGVVAMDADLARSWFGRDGVSDLYVWFRPGVSPVDGQESVRSVVAAAEPDGIAVITGAEYLDGISRQVRAVPSMLNSILVATLIAAVLAVVNAIISGLAERRRELAVLRSMGTRRSTLVRSVTIGTCSVGLVGGLIGVGLGLLLHPLHVRNVSELAAGSRIEFRFEPSIALFGLGSLLVILVVGVVGPARRAVSGEVVDALREAAT